MTPMLTFPARSRRQRQKRKRQSNSILHEKERHFGHMVAACDVVCARKNLWHPMHSVVCIAFEASSIGRVAWQGCGRGLVIPLFKILMVFAKEPVFFFEG